MSAVEQLQAKVVELAAKKAETNDVNIKLVCEEMIRQIDSQILETNWVAPVYEEQEEPAELAA